MCSLVSVCILNFSIPPPMCGEAIVQINETSFLRNLLTDLCLLTTRISTCLGPLHICQHSMHQTLNGGLSIVLCRHFSIISVKSIRMHYFATQERRSQLD